MSSDKVRSLRIYQRFFIMIQDGRKTVEVRVAYPSMKRIKVGDTVRFIGRSSNCDRLVTRVVLYRDFSEMMAAEDPVKINPEKSASDQLEEIRGIFPPNKERLGVIAFEYEPID